jgi:hypothetical protein
MAGCARRSFAAVIRRLASAVVPAGSGRSKSGDRALADQLALELGEGGEDAEHQLAGGGRRVDRRTLPGQHAQSDGARIEIMHDVDQVAQVAAEAIEFPNNDRVAGAHRLETCVETGAVVCPACGRLDRSGALLSGRTPVCETHHHRHGREPHRASRQNRSRTPILNLLLGALGRSLRRRRTRPLGDRKQPPLDPRRHLQRGSVTPARRPRRQKHGRGPPLRPQSGAPSRRQTIHQATPQARRLGS